MTTTIPVEERTRERLFRLISQDQLSLGKRVTYDEFITRLLDMYEQRSKAQARFMQQRGELTEAEAAWDELHGVKSSDESKLSKFVKTPSSHGR